MLDCLGEAIRQMLELMRRELDDVRPDHEQLRSELKTGTTRSSTRRFFGQERLISATLGCVQQSNLDRRS